jgi:hypothetical protein
LNQAPPPRSRPPPNPLARRNQQPSAVSGVATHRRRQATLTLTAVMVAKETPWSHSQATYTRSGLSGSNGGSDHPFILAENLHHCENSGQNRATKEWFPTSGFTSLGLQPKRESEQHCSGEDSRDWVGDSCPFRTNNSQTREHHVKNNNSTKTRAVAGETITVAGETSTVAGETSTVAGENPHRCW